MLTGAALLRKVKELGDASKSELVRSCGYTSKKKDGSERLNFTAFYQALIEAKANRVTGAADRGNALSEKEQEKPRHSLPTEKEKEKQRLNKLRELAQRKVRQGKPLSSEELDALPAFQRRALQHSPIVVESRKDRQRRVRAEAEQKISPVNAKTPIQPDYAANAEIIHRQKLVGDELVKICIYLDDLEMGEHRIAIRAGYTVDNLGAFRRAFARSGGTSLAPLARMIGEYKSRLNIGQAGDLSRRPEPDKTEEHEEQSASTNHHANRNASSDELEIASSTASREYISGHSKRLKRSNSFRSAVLNMHGLQCAACGLGIESLLEAAHIRPAAEMGSDHCSNGIPLCPNHHAAFDQHMFSIDPVTKVIEFANGYSAELLSVNSHRIDLELNQESVEYRYLLFLRANE